MGRDTTIRVLILVVLFHTAVTVAHGWAHAKAAVTLGPAALAFVILIVEVGPLGGLIWMRMNRAAGARLVGVTMAAAFLFGLLNHFVLPGADRVDHVAASSPPLFQATAALLVVVEAAGAALGLFCARDPMRRIA